MKSVSLTATYVVVIAISPLDLGIVVSITIGIYFSVYRGIQVPTSLYAFVTQLLITITKSQDNGVRVWA